MQLDILDNIRIVLVATTHPGNIGAAARAMKTMGIKKMDLVTPKTFPCAEATALAAGADDVLSNARVHEDLQSAIRGCAYILGTSARARSIAWPVVQPEHATRQVLELAGTCGADAAVIFGRESAGLSNEELEACNAVIEIPANPEFSSLNLAAAVQLVCYELRKTAIAIAVATDADMEAEADEPPLASADQMNLFYQHLQQYLTEIDFYDPEKPRLLMRRLKRLFNRSRIDQNEYNILRGILTAGQKAIKDR